MVKHFKGSEATLLQPTPSAKDVDAAFIDALKQAHCTETKVQEVVERFRELPRQRIRDSLLELMGVPNGAYCAFVAAKLLNVQDVLRSAADLLFVSPYTSEETRAEVKPYCGERSPRVRIAGA